MLSEGVGYSWGYIVVAMYGGMTLTNIIPDGYNLVVLQLSIRSMLSNLSELQQLIHMLDNKGTQVDLILLCETFLNKKTIKLVNILGYELIMS